jgi:hypothetical protein
MKEAVNGHIEGLRKRLQRNARVFERHLDELWYGYRRTKVGGVT